MSINEKLIKIQNKLKVPKEHKNSFGGYNYRSCEEIVENAKPVLEEQGLLVTLDDEIVNIGDRYYVKATARLSDGENSIEIHGYAREEENKKGMDSMQLTGATSSYARKYALNGLFAIDDTKDSDGLNKHGKDKKKTKSKKVTLKEMRKKDIGKVKKQLGVDNNTILTEYQSIMQQRGHDDIEKPDEQEWEVIIEQLKENLEGE